MYHVDFTAVAEKQFLKLDKFTQKQLQRYINKNLNGTTNPRQFGKALHGKFKGLWRYSVGKYRLVCNIEDSVLKILLVKVGHRRNIYK